MNVPEQIEDYFQSGEYITWERLARINPPQKPIGYWFWDNVELKWKWVD